MPNDLCLWIKNGNASDSVIRNQGKSDNNFNVLYLLSFFLCRISRKLFQIRNMWERSIRFRFGSIRIDVVDRFANQVDHDPFEISIIMQSY